jgi:type II secretory pathway pseudopilin PulG
MNALQTGREERMTATQASGIKRIRRGPRGFTILEVLIALVILMVGVVGVLAALPVGITSAEWVIFQDAAIHLAHSKFDEFSRDRVDPVADLVPPSSSYLTTNHGAFNSSQPANTWRDFDYAAGKPYEYFDDIIRYEWRLETEDIGYGTGGTPAPPAGAVGPIEKGGTSIQLTRVAVIVHLKGTSREFRFSQYLYDYGRDN